MCNYRYIYIIQELSKSNKQEEEKMFFILNHRNSIIAADPEFLSTLDACDVATASAFINSGEIQLDDYARTLEFDSIKYSFTKNSIYTLFGKGNMYTLNSLTEKENLDKDNTCDKFASLDNNNIDQDIADFFRSDDATHSEKSSDFNQNTDDHTKDFIQEISEPSSSDFSAKLKSKIRNQEENPLASAILSETNSNTHVNIPTQVKTKTIEIDVDNVKKVTKNTNTAHSEIDFTTLANTVGVTVDEYKTFLLDFVNETKNLIPQIKNSKSGNADNAIETLKEATHLLHLPHLTAKVTQIQAHLNQDSRNRLADEFAQLATLSQITQHISKQNDVSDLSNISSAQDNSLDGSIKFSSIDATTPIAFKYNVSEAVTALMLPKSMIQEFVTDFIAQSSRSLTNMEDAYHNNDLAAIKKDAHTLMGIAANLHIEPLVKTLSTLELNNSLKNVPQICQLFAGQIKYLKNEATST